MTTDRSVTRKMAALLRDLAPSGTLDKLGKATTTGVFDDSRAVIPGSIFVAVGGTQVDGRRFIPDALERGAAVIVGEDLPPTDQAVAVNVPDARLALTTLALRWYDLAADGCAGMKLIGITGTNGKTTTAFMVRAILRAAGLPSGLLSTVHYDLCGRKKAAHMTTPGPLQLAAHLRHCADAGAAAVVLEVSSHALDQKRTDGLRFAAAAFTNLSGDHIDYHQTFDAYRDAKARLFSGLRPEATAVINRDDPHHQEMLRDCRAQVMSYALDQEADLRGTIAGSTSRGTAYRLRIGERDVVLENAVVGRHNVYNALAAAGLARAIGVELEAIASGLASLTDVPGRLQRVPCSLPADVFVDYAHSDDALRNALGVLRPLTKRRLIVVFGCGGDRDRSKRPRMAMAAAEFADLIIVTSDNPRHEDPLAIIDGILAGFDADARRRVTVEPDRAQAITEALSAAEEGDVVLLAGKGHETYQLIGERRIHFDDVEVALQAAAEIRRFWPGDA